MRWFLVLLVASFCCALGTTDARAQRERQHGEPFIERFERFSDAHWFVSRWPTDDWMANIWRARQVSFSPGGLRIAMERRGSSDKPFVSGEIQSTDVYQYGYFETRMRAARGGGMVSGFFTYARSGGPLTWDEIDMEILGRDPRLLEATYYRHGERHWRRVKLPFDASAAFHTYAIDWQRDYLRWYADGALLLEVRGVDVPRFPQRIIFNLWATQTLSDWAGPLDRGPGPWTLRVSCLAYTYQRPPRSLCDGTDAPSL